MQCGIASSSPIRPLSNRCVTVSYRLCYTEHPTACPVKLLLYADPYHPPRREELFGCLLPRTTEARLARLLPILARQFGVARDGGWIIELRLTHYHLAEMVASTRESVTAAVNSFRRRGVLEKKAGIIFILEPEELAQTAAPWARTAQLTKRTRVR